MRGMPLENAVMRMAAAGNDLVNTHLLLAWETGAATEREMAVFGFRPSDPGRSRWATVEKMR
jgi:hypothetical protein